MRVGYSTWFVCLSVCGSVTALAASASVYAANQQYSRVSLTYFKSYCVKKILFMSSLRAVFGTFPREGRSNVASETSYWCNRRKTSEIKQLHAPGCEASLCACRYNMWVPERTVYILRIEYPWHVIRPNEGTCCFQVQSIVACINNSFEDFAL